MKKIVFSLVIALFTATIATATAPSAQASDSAPAGSTAEGICELLPWWPGC